MRGISEEFYTFYIYNLKARKLKKKRKMSYSRSERSVRSPRSSYSEPDSRSPTQTVKIKELDLEMIRPTTKDAHNPQGKGAKLVVIGSPGTGKTTLIASLLYAKKHIIPVGVVFSGTEDSNGFYRQMFPSTFVFNKYDEEQLKKVIARQKIALQHLENPWNVLLIDDCTDEPAVFRKPVQLGLYKQGRHWALLYILSLQYCLDIRPAIRSNVDGCFILRDMNLKNRRSLYENYASIIPDFKLFCSIMDAITDDYTALYIHNATQVNDWRECVFWYKAKPVPKDFHFGSESFWSFHNDRFSQEYTDPLF